MGLLGYAGYQLGARRVSADAGLETDPKDLDFGSVWVQDAFAWTLPMRNTSTEAIEIVDVVASCDCTSVEPTSLSIPPGASAQIRLTLDLTTSDPELAELPEREFSVDIVAVLKGDLPRRRVWRVGGLVRTPFRTALPRIDFGESLVRGWPFAPRSAVVRCRDGFKGVKAACDPSLAAVTVAHSPDDPSAFEIQIAPCETLPVGEHQFNVLLTALSGERGPDVSVPLAIVAPVVDDVHCVPSFQHLGAGRIGESLERRFVLRSRTGRVFHVEKVVSHCGDLRVDPSEGPLPEGQEFRLSYRPSKPGEQSARLDFIVRYDATKQPGPVTVSRQFRCHGLPATDTGAPKQ